MMIKNENEVEEFLSQYPHPNISTATTVKKGAVICIKPVPSLFGAELMCSPETRRDLFAVMARIRATKVE